MDAPNWKIEARYRNRPFSLVDKMLSASNADKLKEAFRTVTGAVISPAGDLQHNNTLITINGEKIGAFSQKLYSKEQEYITGKRIMNSDGIIGSK